MAVTAEQVKALRDMTGAGFMECKAALAETGGDIEQAITNLRKRGLAQAARRAGRATREGLVSSYIHMGGKVGVLVEVNCESDFVARTPDFQSLVKEVALQVAAADPKYVRRQDVPAEEIAKEREIYAAQLATAGKPAHIIDKIVDGKLESFFQRTVLMDQPSIRDGNVTVNQLVAEAAAKLGENVSVARFARFKVGEGAQES
jgi:elongation factor Ts